jgi:hypothetical protein
MTAIDHCRSLLVTIALVALVPSQDLLAQSSRRTVEATSVAQQVFDAFRVRNWKAVAELVHPEALTQFRINQIQLARSLEGVPLPNNSAHGFNLGILGFARVYSLPDLEGLGDAELLERWLEGHAQNGDSLGDHPPMVATRKIVGAVTEGDSLVHVVYWLRYELAGRGYSETATVLVAKRFSTGWLVLLNEDIAALTGYSEFDTMNWPR